MSLNPHLQRRGNEKNESCLKTDLQGTIHDALQRNIIESSKLRSIYFVAQRIKYLLIKYILIIRYHNISRAANGKTALNAN